MRLAGARAAAVFVGVALLPACGSGEVIPAAAPADVCSLLTRADLQTILPTVRVGTELGTGPFYPYMDGGDAWSLECDWDDSVSNPTGIGLYVQGALTRQGNADLDVAFDSIGGGPTQGTVVSGLGDEALYFDNSMGSQFLEARSGGYYVELLAFEFATPVTEAQLQPLVLEAIVGLERRPTR